MKILWKFWHKKNLENDEFSEAKTFVRKTSNIDNIYHHIGIYCYSVGGSWKFCQIESISKWN